MSTALMRTSLQSIKLLNGFVKNPSLVCSYHKKPIMTQNERDWIKENSVKLIERVQNDFKKLLMKEEKGIDLGIDLKQPQLFYEKSDELKNADERIKKVFSLEFANRNDYKRYEEELVKKVFQQLPTDENSLEIQIALHTLHIKRICNDMKNSRGKNRKVEFYLYRYIHRRDRMLTQLFYQDNSRYKWIIDKLNLTGHELVESFPYKRVTRYEKSINESNEAAEKKRIEKLESTRKEFEAQRAQFLEEKKRVLKEIQEEIQKLGITDIKFPSTHQVS